MQVKIAKNKTQLKYKNQFNAKLTLALTFDKFIEAGRNRGECSAQKLLEMIISQSVAILVLI